MNTYLLFDTRLLLLRARRRAFLRVVMWLVLVLAAGAGIGLLTLALMELDGVHDVVWRVVFPPVILRG